MAMQADREISTIKFQVTSIKNESILVKGLLLAYETQSPKARTEKMKELLNMVKVSIG